MIDLKVDQSLINRLFDGYKLSKDTLNITTVDIPLIDEGSKNTTHFSYAYSKATQLHNHMYKNPWDNSLYFIDKDCIIQRVVRNQNVKDVSICDVFQIPDVTDNDDRISCSVLFPSSQMALLHDGAGKIYLLNTTTSPRWSVVSNKPIYDINEQGYLMHSELRNNLLNCIVVSIKDSLKSDTSQVLVQWIQFSSNNFSEFTSNVNIVNVSVFLGKGLPNLCWLDKDDHKMFILSDCNFQQVNSETLEPVPPNVRISDNRQNGHTKKYKWTQSKESISVIYGSSIVEEKDVSCEFTHDSILLKIDQTDSIIEGKLEKDILVESSRWFIQDGRLEVVLVKKDAGLFWSSVVPGDMYGEHLIEGEEAAKLEEVHQSLAHLTSSDDKMEDITDANVFNMQQLEECDQNMEDDIALYSFDVRAAMTEKLVNLGSHQLIFTLNPGAVEPPLICLREDVDGIVWRTSPTINDNWKHITTFDAFGYVLASKQQHKFVSCTSDYSYAFVTDCTSHVYIYEQSRKSRNQHKQYVVSLDSDSSNIFGFEVIGNILFVITNRKLHVIELPTSE